VLQSDLTLPSGKIISAGAVLTEIFIEKTSPGKSDDNERMRMMNRRSEIKILRTDYK
jgi:hypothetical protein